MQEPMAHKTIQMISRDAHFVLQRRAPTAQWLCDTEKTLSLDARVANEVSKAM
jgi:hypothetical protein